MKYLIFVLLLSGASVYAQDIITLRNGDEIRARVLEISSSELRYKRFDNLEGPTIIVPRNDVFFINYEDGTREIITSLSKPSTTINRGENDLTNIVNRTDKEQIVKPVSQSQLRKEQRLEEKKQRKKDRQRNRQLRREQIKKYPDQYH